MYMRNLAQSPQSDLIYAGLDTLDDSSWIWRDLCQTALGVHGSDIFSQIGQLGIVGTLTAFGIIFVSVASAYEDLKTGQVE